MAIIKAYKKYFEKKQLFYKKVLTKRKKDVNI